MIRPIKCPVPGCDGTDFYSTTTNGERRPVYVFTRDRGKLKRHDIGDAVVCCRCDTPLIVTAEESYLTQRAIERMRSGNGGMPARPANLTGPREEPKERPATYRPVGIEP